MPVQGGSPGHVLSSVGNVSYGVKLYNGQTSCHHIDHIRKRFDIDTTTQPKHPPRTARTEVTKEPEISLDQTTPPLLNPSTTKTKVDNSEQSTQTLTDSSTADTSTIQPLTFIYLDFVYVNYVWCCCSLRYVSSIV